MEAKDKARELVDRFEDLLNPDRQTYKCTECKEAALICASEVLRELAELDRFEHVPTSLLSEWVQVSVEINKL